MVYQSNIRQADGEGTKVEPFTREGIEVEGVFVIANAYEGSYEYFQPPKPTPSAPPTPRSTEGQPENK
jgi:hypothetical protein